MDLEGKLLKSVRVAGHWLISGASFRDNGQGRGRTGQVSAGEFDPGGIAGLILKAARSCCGQTSPLQGGGGNLATASSQGL